MDTFHSPRLIRYNRLFTAMEAAYHEAGTRLGLSDCTMQILYAISECGTARSLTDIVATTAIPKQTINSALRKLEHDGFVTLELLEKRRKLVRLTPAGEELAKNTVARLAAIENAVVQSYSPEDWEQYLTLSERHIQLFTEKIKEL